MHCIIPSAFVNNFLLSSARKTSEHLCACMHVSLSDSTEYL